MSSETLKIFLAMAAYMLVVIGIGLFFAKRAQANSENYFLGGRSLGPWVAAMSAEASDMSGWLLMGLPGVAYWCGISDAMWTALRSGHRNLYQLAGCGPAAAEVFGSFR